MATDVTDCLRCAAATSKLAPARCLAASWMRSSSGSSGWHSGLRLGKTRSASSRTSSASTQSASELVVRPSCTSNTSGSTERCTQYRPLEWQPTVVRRSPPSKASWAASSPSSASMRMPMSSVVRKRSWRPEKGVSYCRSPDARFQSIQPSASALANVSSVPKLVCAIGLSEKTRERMSESLNALSMRRGDLRSGWPGSDACSSSSSGA